ncbi:MAG: hypothetical protein JNK48_18110, partial [Bryobacterales bacterium]|nr:hypothetical protein [Bryobacterales bacterium]
MNHPLPIILHILRKDLTGLRWQIMLLLSLQSLFAALHFRPLPTSGPTTAEVVLGVLLI